MFAFTTQRPCCITETNVCGLDATAYGMGCIDVSAAMGGVKMMCDGTMTGASGSGGNGSGGSGSGGSGG
jgi:hypothetical protein